MRNHNMLHKSLRIARMRNLKKIVRTFFYILITAILFGVMTVCTMLVLYHEKLQYPQQWKTQMRKQFNKGLSPNPRDLEFYNLTSTTPEMEGFECIKTSTSPTFTQCIYSLSVDVHISQSIKTNGIWEPGVTGLVLEVLNSDDRSVFLDVGANVGYYSLLSAKTGHLTLAIEPDVEHAKRFRASISIERLERRVIMLRNAVAERRMLATVRRSGHNQGDTQIQMEVKECQGACPPTVKTIVMNDLTYLMHDLALMSTNEKETDSDSSLFERLMNFRNSRIPGLSEEDETEIYKIPPANVVIKLDVQGFEHKIFQAPDFFFDRNRVTHIFMEWYYMARSHPKFNKTGEAPIDSTYLGQRDLGPKDAVKVEKMIGFLSGRGFRPYGVTKPRVGEALNPDEWHLWPFDILWCHDSQTLLMGKLAFKNLLGLS